MCLRNFPPDNKSVLVFGSQWLSFNVADFQRLRAIVLDEPENHWMLDVLGQLPQYYRIAETTYLPQLKSVNGEQKLRELEKGFRCDNLSPASFPLTYAQLAPLLMMTHFIQYCQYLRLTHPEYVSTGILTAGTSPIMENVGFCIGFLGAAVASAAATREQLQSFAGVAMRLAMLLGALGDAQEAEEEYTSLATVCKTPDLRSRLHELIQAHYGAYITVHFDDNRATIMTPRRKIGVLQKSLQLEGFSASPVELNGRYHWTGHEGTLAALFALCNAHKGLQLPDAATLVRPLRANDNAELIQSGPLHQIALRAILVQRCLWFQTFSAVYHAHLEHSRSLVIEFGPERCVPPSFIHRLRSRIIHFADLDLENLPSRDHQLSTRPVCENDIAIIGMSCRVAGADDVNEFWKILCAGESQHQEFPPERYANYETPWRLDASTRPWFGNFVRHIDAFDHKFFKKSPREAMSQDPQQRLILQVAYQALEQSGYFFRPPQSKSIGCYIASCTVDYEHNVNCHPATAYSATGLLRSFIAGKLSHYFGWRGPSLCIDTACSGSTVALHHACRAILNGDCTAALVGGANAITSPLAYDNLAGAAFLSPTGPCKPFDAKADGYCRGEGFAAVFIKKLSDALENGDPVLATIAATAVEQNDNCTPIVVPDKSSLAGLFQKVTDRARLYPRDITVVEAHGTGTQAGDPAEYLSIREILGGPQRIGKLALGSVKGLVGHTEGVSGIVALIKAVIMINKRQIPPQPGFQLLNPHIHTAEDDHIEIGTKLKPWNVGFRAVLINNYGACGSNASMVVTQGPKSGVNKGMGIHVQGLTLPFRLCALDNSRLREYVVCLRQFLSQLQGEFASLANIAFSSARQSNPSLESQLVFSATSTIELDSVLAEFEHGGDKKNLIQIKKPFRPIFLCFGGQIGKYIGLDRNLYEAIPLFRHHLDACDEILRARGEKGLYPGIFDTAPVEDPVELQTQLFALQYACGRSWIDSGVVVTAIIGHSFGEITALCVSGILSLTDTITIVVKRATVIRDHWGPDSGAMLAVDGEKGLLEEHLSGSLANIACFNGPRSFTVAGPTSAVNEIQAKLAGNRNFHSKKLEVTNAFHSSLVDPLVPELQRLTDGITLHPPTTPIERATRVSAGPTLPSSFIADHLRNPVYFEAAVNRLADRHGPAIWLEAGSNSTVTSMARRALGPTAENHTFHPFHITTNMALQNLTSTTVNLWKQGIPSVFWAHHPYQSNEYLTLLLPPYQFEKSRHWLENKALPSPTIVQPVEERKSPLIFAEHGGSLKGHTKFRVDTSHPHFVEAVSGHIAAGTTPIAPASLLIDYAIEALRSLPEGNSRVPEVSNIESEAPLCLNSNRQVFIEFSPRGYRSWALQIYSQDVQPGSTPRLLHCAGQLVMHDPADPALKVEFTRYGRLVSYNRCLELLSSPDVDDILQGRNIYRTFSKIVEYSEAYRGVRKLVGRESESAGRVVKSYTGETWADAFLSDTFSQVAGFWVNCMTDCPEEDIYIASGMEQWMRTPLYADIKTRRPTTWEVWAKHQRGEGFYTSDVFVFGEGELVEVFLGLRYSRVAKKAFSRILSGFTAQPQEESDRRGEKKFQTSSQDVSARVRVAVAEICAIDPKDIRDDSSLADAGVDSLMAMELARELDEVFQCTLSVSELLQANTFADLLASVERAVGTILADARSCTSKSDSSSCGSSSEKPSSTVESNTSVSDTAELSLPHKIAIEAFSETKTQTDKVLADNQCSGRLHTFTPLQAQLCLLLTLEAFEDLGSNIRAASTGQTLQRVPFDVQHEALVNYLYARLAEARLIELQGANAIRTALPAPMGTSTSILNRIVADYPEYAGASRLTYYTGRKLAPVLRGDEDGLQLIFGTPEGQKLVSWMYGEEPHNVAGYKLMLEFIQRVVNKIRIEGEGPLRIMEMGAGTGGGTKWFLPVLASLPVPVQYTFSDISPSFVAQARRKFRQYPFIRYYVHDIEKAPTEDLLGTQHIIIASNAVHATSNLQESTRYMRQALRDDGVLMMLEMTRPVFAIDLVFGLFRGWWVFNDGRTHAITNEEQWEKDLHAAGYGHVDWTDGLSNEASVQRVLFATAQGKQEKRHAICSVDNGVRIEAVEKYVYGNVEGFTAPIESKDPLPAGDICVLLTGATGSLGCHLLADLVQLSTVQNVICLNRTGKEGALQRQIQALVKRKIFLSPDEKAKLLVIESKLEDRNLGLTTKQYDNMRTNVTHIVHNAWPMNGMMPLPGFEEQFKILRNLVDLAREIASRRKYPIRFQFISSIGTVGGGRAVEEQSHIEKVLCNGYNEAKFVCERIIQETLCRYPESFQAMIVRPGQISGSSSTGYWNSAEHFPAIVRSSQKLGVFPALNGTMAWTPVDIVAGVLLELLFDEGIPEPIYHIDNPEGQDWSRVVEVFVDELRVSTIAFAEWIRRVREATIIGNPAGLMADWLEENFQRMSCGGGLDTRVARTHSKELREMGEVGEDVVRKYIRAWKEQGFLS